MKNFVPFRNIMSNCGQRGKIRVDGLTCCRHPENRAKCILHCSTDCPIYRGVNDYLEKLTEKEGVK